MTLSFTKAPTGSALTMALLVVVEDRLELGDRADGEPEHPEPLAGRHLVARGVAGGVPHGRVALSPRLRQHLAGWERPVLAVVALVLVLQPHFGELGDDVLPDLPVWLRSFMPGRKPRISWLPAPRPVPNSNRPPERWSSMATRSATLAGWLTWGKRVEDARAEVDALGGVGQVAEEGVVGREVGVLVEEVVLAGPDVLEARPCRRRRRSRVPAGAPNARRPGSKGAGTGAGTPE
jgi:hypothetical protein